MSTSDEPDSDDRNSHNQSGRVRRRSPLAWVVIGLVVAYRKTLGPFMTGVCRYRPTCSQYMLDAVEKYGAIRGGWRGVKRICRCHPFHDGGHDPA